MVKLTLTIRGKLINCLKNMNPTLTVRGFRVGCINNTTSVMEPKFDWGNALIDAIITSGITFFSTLGGTALAGDINTVHILTSATVAAFSQFFVFLALKRGLVKPETNQPQNR